MLTGQSPQILAIRRMIREIAKTDENVLLIGEVGCGKKYIAKEIQQRSRQRGKPFIVVNCTALGDTITDSDLFGERIDAPRGVERKLGFLEQAHRGILYLENIDELPLEYQQKIFNILTEKRFRREGEEHFTDLELRVFGASADEGLLKNDQLRKDLIALISAFSIQIPSLRKRKQDIPILFTHFLETFCTEMNRDIPSIPADIFESLIEYDWRGNVRELEGTVRNLLLMSPEGSLSVEYLPFEVKKHPFQFLEEKDLPEAVSEVETYLIRKTLQKFAGNQTKAANALNVSEAALRYKMKKYGFSKKMF